MPGEVILVDRCMLYRGGNRAGWAGSGSGWIGLSQFYSVRLSVTGLVGSGRLLSHLMSG
jgi:hypothetical protein